jgi:hypothetical protein
MQHCREHINMLARALCPRNAVIGVIAWKPSLYYGYVSSTSGLEAVGFFIPIILLALAGILALAGRSRYKAWRPPKSS